jgi:hypothetical protein
LTLFSSFRSYFTWHTKRLTEPGCPICPATQAWDVFKAAAANGLGFTNVVKKGKWVTAHGGHLTDLIAAGA